MGAGCSSYAGKTVQLPQGAECPARPACLACDLVGPPIVEKVYIGHTDVLIEQAAQFAEAVCALNDSLNGLLLDVRLATGLLQGGFSLLLTPAPNVDIFSFELLTASGRPLEVAEAARLRGRDLTCNGKLAALDAQLAQCLEDLADSFVKKVGATGPCLMLSSKGTLVPKTQGQPLDPVVEAFNRTMLDMRTTLGSDYLLALHLHKAQAHGMPAFRVRLLKDAPEASRPGVTAASAAATAAATDTPSGFRPATLLDQTACLNASRLADALHEFQDANGRLAAALQQTGLISPLAVVTVSPRTVSLAGTCAAAAAAATATARCTSPNPQHPQPVTSIAALAAANAVAAATGQQGRQPARSDKSAAARAKHDPAAVAAAAVRSLPAASRLRAARAVERLNGAVHALAHAAAAAPGPASFAALLTHVLGELRDVVAAAGGESALESYQPSVDFVGGPDSAPSLEFRLDPQLQQLSCGGGAGDTGAGGHGVGGGGVGGGRRSRPPLTFPHCLSPPVRRAWLLLQELLRVHNSTVAQLGPLRQLAEAFEEGLRRRIASIPQDAAAARMSLAQAAKAGRALVRNHVELRDCWQSALHVLASTARLVRDEMAEAAQLARVQCSFMSPTAWSVSVASSCSPNAATLTPPSLGGAPGSVTSSPRWAAGGGLSGRSSDGHSAPGSLVGHSPASVLGANLRHVDTPTGGGGGTSIRSRGGGSVAKNLAVSFETMAVAAGLEELPGALRLGSLPDVASVHDQQQQQQSVSRQQPRVLSRSRSASVVAGSASPRRIQRHGGAPPPSAPGDCRSSCGGGGGGGGCCDAAVRTVTDTVSRSTVSCTAAGPSQANTPSPVRRMTDGDCVGWLQLDGSAADGGAGSRGAVGGPMGNGKAQVLRPPRPHRPDTQSPTAVAAGRGRMGRRESLADEYARAALAHLRLQEL